MRLTQIGRDYVVVNEESLKDSVLLSIPRIHLIKMSFGEPTKEKIEAVLQLFPRTNRFVIDREIKIYNDALKYTAKKFYVENRVGASIISFFRKNNKVLVNFNRLRGIEKEFLLNEYVLPDMLRNVEVVQLAKVDLDKVYKCMECWDGNIIVCED